jgi:UPF0716 family protein affecting phage T7 exclusion
MAFAGSASVKAANGLLVNIAAISSVVPGFVSYRKGL